MNPPNPCQKEFFEKSAEEWDNVTHHNPDKLEQIARLLAPKPEQTVLDVGCGTGAMIPWLLMHVQKTGTIVAVDYSKNMIEVAKRKYPAEDYPNVVFQVQDVNDMAMRREYDAILCYSCFPHFVDQRATIHHLVKGLGKGGKLMVAHSESREAINNMHKAAAEEVHHDFLPPMVRIAQMMEAAGLRVLEKIDNDELFVIMAEQPD